MYIKLAGIYKKFKNFSIKNFNLKFRKGEKIGLVGTSGSGKTTIASIILRLLKPDSGNFYINEKDAYSLKRRDFSRMVQGIFQNPSRALNPGKKISFLLKEPFLVHRQIPSEEEILSLLYRLSLPVEILEASPSQLSGGQLQRIAIGRAISLNPDFLIADEPTSALDPTVQIQIIDLLLKLNREKNIGLLFISHDLNQVFYISQRVVVLSEGIIVETGKVEDVLSMPHPYTEFLMKGSPAFVSEEKGACPFYGLCPFSREICRRKLPELKEVGKNHKVRCHFM